MSDHKVTTHWQRTTEDFQVKTYNRTHTAYFSGGSKIEVTAAPEYFGDPKITNPEELLVAAISSCHMLTFLAMAAMKNLIVDEYKDDAVGKLGKNAQGKMAVTEITLNPQVKFGGTEPDDQILHELHEKAHANCFIANSVNTEIKIAGH